jgi:hypothetical protein
MVVSTVVVALVARGNLAVALQLTAFGALLFHASAGTPESEVRT